LKALSPHRHRREGRHRDDSYAAASPTLAGGGVSLGLGDAKDADISTGVGILVGGILVWTKPWRSPACKTRRSRAGGGISVRGRASTDPARDAFTGCGVVID
jgi:hypothetical protein